MENNITNIFEYLSEQFCHFNGLNMDDMENEDVLEYNQIEYNIPSYEPNTFTNYTFNNIVDNLTMNIIPGTQYQYYSFDASNVQLRFPYSGNSMDDVQNIYYIMNHNHNDYNEILTESFQENQQHYIGREQRNINTQKCIEKCKQEDYQSDVSYKNDICPILYKPFQEGDKIWKLPCEHIIHNERFHEYIGRFDYCPLCMNKIIN